MKRLTNAVVIGLCCLFVLLLIAGIFAYSFAAVLVSSSCALRSGRTVTVQADEGGGVSTSASNDTATLKVGDHAIVVAPTQLLFEGHQVATIDKDAKLVTINLRKGKISVVVDGKEIETLER